MPVNQSSSQDDKITTDNSSAVSATSVPKQAETAEPAERELEEHPRGDDPNDDDPADPESEDQDDNEDNTSETAEPTERELEEHPRGDDPNDDDPANPESEDQDDNEDNTSETYDPQYIEEITDKATSLVAPFNKHPNNYKNGLPMPQPMLDKIAFYKVLRDRALAQTLLTESEYQTHLDNGIITQSQFNSISLLRRMTFLTNSKINTGLATECHPPYIAVPETNKLLTQTPVPVDELEQLIPELERLTARAILQWGSLGDTFDPSYLNWGIGRQYIPCGVGGHMEDIVEHFPATLNLVDSLNS